MSVADKIPKSGDSWLNFWRISVLGVLLAISMYFNHIERKAHNVQMHELTMKLAECMYD